MRRLLLLPLLAVAFAPGAWAADETHRALDALSSPAERVRTAAVERLIDLLPASRGPVIEALPEASPDVRLHLVEVLARDGSAEAVRALLRTLAEADDLLASRIQILLARDGGATRAVLDAWRERPATRRGPGGKPLPRMESLERVLRRAEAEELFLSRKSKTGATGSYRGQYQLLEPYREEAVELCVDILMDRAPAIPGIVRVGKFTFLRDADVNWDIDEIQSMAAHAIGELMRPDDYKPLLELTSLLKRLGQGMERTNPRFDEVKFRQFLARYIDLLIALYRVRPEHHERRVEALVEELEYGRAQYYALPSTLPMLLLRVGRYQQAVHAYREILDVSGLTISRALTYYNLACAFAQWGQELEGGPRAELYDLAIEHLRSAVANHWSDVGWLDEDRDLDPIRDRPEFAAIRAEMLRAITPPDED